MKRGKNGNKGQDQRRQWQRRWIWILGLLTVLQTGWAHDLFAEYVRHHVRLQAQSNHIDLTLELTFFEESSARERQQMDLNGDGRVLKSELRAYVRALSGALTNKVNLCLGGKPLSLIPLYAPEIDLLGYHGLGHAHHRLTLYYFAVLPPEVGDGAVLEVSDRLWSGQPALMTAEAAGAGGFSLRPVIVTDPMIARLREDESRVIRFSVEEAPSSGSVPAPSPAMPRNPGNS
jgi:hypothetical protein